MATWAIEILCFLLLFGGTRYGKSGFQRILCRIGLAYYVIFCVTYYFWLNAQYRQFKAHPDTIHVGITQAFAFEAFMPLFSNMVMLYAVVPVALVFMAYFAVKWLAASPRPGSTSY